MLASSHLEDTVISRKVVVKTVHATIPKGNVGYVQYTCSWHYSCRTYFCCFSLALANICPWPFLPFFEISLKNSELKTTHNTFRDCRVDFFRQPFSKQLYSWEVTRERHSKGGTRAKGRSFAALSAGQSKWRARLQANYFLVAFESDLREDFIDEDCFQSVRHFWKVCRVRVGTKKSLRLRFSRLARASLVTYPSENKRLLVVYHWP